MMRAHTAPASLGLCWHRWVRGSGLALGLCGCGSSQGSGGDHRRPYSQWGALPNPGLAFSRWSAPAQVAAAPLPGSRPQEMRGADGAVGFCF